MTKAFDDALDPGTRIGPVVIGDVIGQGGFGIVYRAVHDRERDVAVKEFFPKQFASRGSSGTLRASQRRWDEAWTKGLAQFAEEARALKRLRHSNIVRIHELIEQNGSAYAVMELVEGETLDRMLAGGRKLAPDQVMSIAKGLIEALRHMNQRGIVHRDIAPDNVIITPDGEPMLIDFGGARHQVGQLTMTLPDITRPGYTPFESSKSIAAIDEIGPWTDIYATAALLYRLVTSETPKDSAARIDERAHSNRDPQPLLSDRKDLLKDYPKAWLAAVDKGLALKPQDRPQSAEAWAEEFRFVGGRRSRPGRGSPGKFRRFAEAKWAIPVALAVAALVTVVVMVQWGRLSKSASDDWQTAEQTNTVAGYQKYIAEWPESQQAAIANIRIANLDFIAAHPPGSTFRDCDVCPEMVVIPAGSFTMGSPPDEPNREADEGPQFRVNIDYPFALAKYEFTLNQFDICVRDGGCKDSHTVTYAGGPSDLDEGEIAASEASLVLLVEYLAWLAAKSGEAYTIPTEAEWEYAARAGTTTPYYTGEKITAQQAAFGNTGRAGFVGQFAPNGFGLHDMAGNAWELVAGCYLEVYPDDHPKDGSHYTGGACDRAIFRGGANSSPPTSLRSATRIGRFADGSSNALGFRVMRRLLIPETLPDEAGGP